MKIYFSASIRGGRENATIYKEIIALLQKYGEVLTEHIGDTELSDQGEKKDVKFIFKRDMLWIEEADIMVADVSTPSIGVGYEIRYAQELGKKIICLYFLNSPKKISGMIEGNPEIKIINYRAIGDIIKPLVKELEQISTK